MKTGKYEMNCINRYMRRSELSHLWFVGVVLSSLSGRAHPDRKETSDKRTTSSLWRLMSADRSRDLTILEHTCCSVGLASGLTDHTICLSSFALRPTDMSALKGASRKTRGG